MWWLTSCDDDALAAGINLALLGRELIQFGRATPLGEGQFRLSHLLRGRGGTEWACQDHGPDDVFCLIRAASLQPIALPSSSVGATITATIAGGTPAATVFSAEGLRPPSPVALTAQPQPNGDLALTWIRRSRIGFAWVDEIDAPLGETREQYRVSIAGTLSSVELVVDQPSLTVTSATLSALGTGAAAIAVRQIGDFAASRPAQLTLTLP